MKVMALKILCNTLMILGYVAIVFSTVFFLVRYGDSKSSRDYYATLSQPILNTVEIPSVENSFMEWSYGHTDMTDTTGADVKEEVLLEPNYIYIEGTNICYPVVRGEDNLYYLHHLPNGERSSFGSIFIDYRNKPGDFNTVIYGHNMKDGTMFGQLTDYYTVDGFAEEHSKLLTSINGIQEVYSLFSVQYTRYDSSVYELNPVDQERWITQQTMSSMIKCEVGSSVPVNFITLSTCGANADEKVVIVWVKY